MMFGRRAMRWGASGVLWGLVLVVPVIAEAAPAVELRQSVVVGRLGRAVQVQIVAGDAGAVLLVERQRVTLPLAVATKLAVQNVTLSGGNEVAIVRVSGESGAEVAALLVRNARGVEVLWSGALDARGDPGERRGSLVDVADHMGDGQPDIVVGRFAERANVCGHARSMLDPQILDAQTLTLKPIALARLSTASAQTKVIEITASAESPGPSAVPLLSLLRMSAVSSEQGSQTESVSAPSSLTDGDPKTFWVEGNRGGSRGEFASFRWGGGIALRAIAIVPLPASLPKDRALSVARSVWLVGDAQERLRVTLPQAPEAGRRYWVVPQAPLAWRCLSIVFEETALLTPDKAAPAVLAEVEVYTDLDFSDGLQALVRELSEAGPKGNRAAELLGTIGPAVAPKLLQAWPTLTIASVETPSGSARRSVTSVIAREM